MLQLQRELADSYVERVTELGLSDLADKCRATPDSAIGGASKEESDKHFCGLFPNSVGRTQFACLDPASSLGELPDTLLRTLLLGRVAILDVPCGSGAGSLGLLLTIAQLRVEGALPRFPLDVRLFGGEISGHAMDHFIALFAKMQPVFHACEMTVVLDCLSWDAVDARSTALMMDRVCARLDSVQTVIVLVTNFSGAMSDADFAARVQTNVTQVVSRIAGRSHAVVWLESGAASAQKVLGKVISFFQKHLSWLTSDSASSLLPVTNYRLRDPWNGNVFRSAVSVVQFEPGALAWKGIRER